ncbi:serine hydrolase domain-containing protein [Neptunicella sp. SCSIO 80796]|uniref:serine hydrolase domain-containing protein n=1 Tax=Neptunicella plasticusilytica TaxID=3117012 RepID=UPI003A4E0CC7
MKNKQRTVWILRIIAAIVTIASVVIFAPWQAAYLYLKPLPDTVQQEVDNAIDYDLDGMVVYVGKKGQPPAFYTAGWKDRDKQIPADPQGLFKIASISKLYDAVAITKLVHNKRLSLDKTLADYFPELIGRIDNADKITLKLMVQHRSGIPNFTDSPNYWQHPAQSSQQALELILDLPANFKPDEDYEYSNTNYLLLSELIEKVTGLSKFQYIKEKILIPLGLTHTFGSIHDVDMDDVISGYYVGIDEDIKTADYSSMLATAEDVGRFLRALNDGSVFDDPEEQAIYSSIYVYEHTGLVPGYQSFAKYHQDIDTVVVEFVNTTNFSGDTWILSEVVFNRIGRILHEQ